jgi:leucyl/phenylalanyl-tRNA---protein transferase
MANKYLHKAERVVLKAAPDSLHDPIRRKVLRGLKFIDDIKTPVISLGNSVAMTAQPRVVMLRSAPTAPQVVASYTRGQVLFGRSPAFPAPFMWRTFPARGIITPASAKIPRDVRYAQRHTDLKVRFDEDFEEIIRSCRGGRDHWVWLTPSLIDVYREVHQLGFVSTVGVYRDDQLVAGLWGISVGRVLGIMSMFHRESGSGSLTAAAAVEVVSSGGRWSIIDSGVIGPHFLRFGAFEVPQEEFGELVWATLRS